MSRVRRERRKTWLVRDDSTLHHIALYIYIYTHIYKVCICHIHSRYMIVIVVLLTIDHEFFKLLTYSRAEFNLKLKSEESVEEICKRDVSHANLRSGRDERRDDDI